MPEKQQDAALEAFAPYARGGLDWWLKDDGGLVERYMLDVRRTSDGKIGVWVGFTPKVDEAQLQALVEQALKDAANQCELVHGLRLALVRFDLDKRAPGDWQLIEAALEEQAVESQLQAFDGPGHQALLDLAFKFPLGIQAADVWARMAEHMRGFFGGHPDDARGSGAPGE